MVQDQGLKHTEMRFFVPQTETCSLTPFQAVKQNVLSVQKFTMALAEFLLPRMKF